MVFTMINILVITIIFILLLLRLFISLLLSLILIIRDSRTPDYGLWIYNVGICVIVEGTFLGDPKKDT